MIRLILIVAVLLAGYYWLRRILVKPKAITRDQGKLAACHGCDLRMPEDELTMIGGQGFCPACADKRRPAQ